AGAAASAWAATWLLRQGTYDRVIVSDPRVVFFASPAPLWAVLADSPIAVVPRYDDPPPASPGMAGPEPGLYDGTLLALQASRTALAFCESWQDHMTASQYSDPGSALAATERYLEIAVATNAAVQVVRDPRIGVTPWNAQARGITWQGEGPTTGGHEVVTFSFAALDPSRTADECDVLSAVPAPLSAFHDALLTEHSRFDQMRAAWAYATYTDGQRVTRGQRRYFASRVSINQRFTNPFAPDKDSFRHWLEHTGPGLHTFGELPRSAERRRHWDRYAKAWEFGEVYVEDTAYASGHELGDEWGSTRDLALFVREFVTPFASTAAVAVEIGCGGGRVSSLIAPLVGSLTCYDPSAEMVRLCRERLSNAANVRVEQITSGDLPNLPRSTVDLIVSVDTFVHFDLALMWRYFEVVSHAMRPGGTFIVHTACLDTDDGWMSFTSQGLSAFSLQPITRDTVRLLAHHAGMTAVSESIAATPIEFLRRDAVFVFAKPAAAQLCRPTSRSEVR
ncbi:MAG TPA: class I SAM-dependent methyltransferase, partial [Solirubrobacteraceae bacterium]